MKNIFSGVVVALCAFQGVVAEAAESANEFYVYLGTYTGRKSQGIYVSRFDAATGKLGEPQLAAESSNPTFVTVFPRTQAGAQDGRYFLYAANEDQKGALTAYSIDRQTGKLTLLNQKSSRGNGPCHLSVDATGKFLYTANYGSGNMAALPIKADGSLEDASAFVQNTGSGANPQRQKEPHAHWIDVDPSNRFVLACDLGIDKVLISKFDPAKGMLDPVDAAAFKLTPGSGPRHIAFHPNGRFAYIISELANTVTAASWDAQKGTLTEIQTIGTLPQNFKGENTTAEIQVHPSGKFLYGSNRGHDSLAIYSIDPQTGRLALIKQQSVQGKTPRNFCIDPTGKWLLAAHQNSDSVIVFKLNESAGVLTPTGQTIAVGSPVCVQFVPAR